MGRGVNIPGYGLFTFTAPNVTLSVRNYLFIPRFHHTPLYIYAAKMRRGAAWARAPVRALGA